MTITEILNTGLAFMGWLFIMVQAGKWFTSVVLNHGINIANHHVARRLLMSCTMPSICRALSQVQPFVLPQRAL